MMPCVNDRSGDVIGVMKTQGDQLDNAYLDKWAAEIDVKDLRDQARSQL